MTMRELRLLERIAHMARGDGTRTETLRISCLKRSVVDHLTRLLNTRDALIDATLNVADFTHLTSGMAIGSTQEIEAEICRRVRRYEPRIRSPQVRFNHESTHALLLRFWLEGWLDTRSDEATALPELAPALTVMPALAPTLIPELIPELIPLRMDAAVGANGQISVRYV